MNDYNPMPILDGLFADFPAVFAKLGTNDDWIATGVRYAQAGAGSEWDVELESLIRNRLAASLSVEALSWYEDEAATVAFFSCYVLGFFAGKLLRREISETEFLLADAQLPGFIILNV
ncbi:hypothetical protein EON80_27445 [bacterium]|nr:MAG: hypothetical protein EON80_27445 [bacterium]